MVSPVAVALGVAVSNGFSRSSDHDGDEGDKRRSKKSKNDAWLAAQRAGYLDSGLIKGLPNLKDAIYLTVNVSAGRFKDTDGDLDGNMSVQGVLKNISVELDSGPQTVMALLRMHFADPNDPNAPPVFVDLKLTDRKEYGAEFSPTRTAMKVLGRLNAADLAKPISIKPWLVLPGTKINDDFTAEKLFADVMVSQMDSSTAQLKSLGQDYGNGVTELPMEEDRTVWFPLMQELCDSVKKKTVQQRFQEESPDDGMDINEQVKGLRPKQS
jgi:hypothetical protein